MATCPTCQAHILWDWEYDFHAYHTGEELRTTVAHAPNGESIHTWHCRCGQQVSRMNQDTGEVTSDPAFAGVDWEDPAHRCGDCNDY